MNARTMIVAVKLAALAGVAAAVLAACATYEGTQPGDPVSPSQGPAEMGGASPGVDGPLEITVVGDAAIALPPAESAAVYPEAEPNSAVEEITVTGTRRSVRQAQHGAGRERLAVAQVAESEFDELADVVLESGGQAESVAPAPTVRELLARAEPGEEIWIISKTSRPLEGGASADDDAPGSGAMLAALRPDEMRPGERQTTVPLPLRHTAVQATVTGYIGTVDVTQQFENPFDRKIEAVYLFPLPEKAAVSEFVMTIGERRIRGILREKEEAEQIYREARAQGYQASLLVQHRPNVFEQRVANIEPGKQIDVNIRYFHTLAYRDGWYSFVFPTVVGPRYNPPGSTDPMLALPRAQVQPAPSAAVRYLRPNERSGHDISIDVELEAGVAIEAIEASHAIDRTNTGESSARIALANRASLPNRDFVLSFKVAGDRLKSNMLTYVDPETSQGYFTMMLYPPSDLGELERQAMEMVFVLDCSGSMSGQPMAQAKDAILHALGSLEPSDTFQIIRFSNNASQFGPAPVPATAENIRRARKYVEQLNGMGGTQMIEGIRAALDFPHDPERLRYVTFMTDGYIGNEADIIGAIHERIGASRIFSFGVGNSVNRYLLERMASEGRGAVAYLGLEDSGSEIMDFFFDRISHPALIDVEIDWGSMYVTDVYPARMPDVFVGRPVVVTGKYSGERSSPVVRGYAGGRELRFELAGDPQQADGAFIANIWARLKIADLTDRQAWTNDPYQELARAIRDVALEYGLMSNYTAFVAVDASQRTAGEFGTTVYQAVPVPDGVRYDTTVGQ